MSEPHEVSMMCDCPNIEGCTLERYISDVRIAVAELELLRAQVGLSEPVSATLRSTGVSLWRK